MIRKQLFKLIKQFEKEPHRTFKMKHIVTEIESPMDRLNTS